MPTLYATFGQVCEAGMLICFGLSWPISILKSLRTKIVHGKSQGFMWLIFGGYLSGLTSKMFQAVANDSWPDWTTPLYILNLLLVGWDIYLYHRYKHNTIPAAAKS
jgi:hypothetical protein